MSNHPYDKLPPEVYEDRQRWLNTNLDNRATGVQKKIQERISKANATGMGGDHTEKMIRREEALVAAKADIGNKVNEWVYAFAKHKPELLPDLREDLLKIEYPGLIFTDQDRDDLKTEMASRFDQEEAKHKAQQFEAGREAERIKAAETKNRWVDYLWKFAFAVVLALAVILLKKAFDQ